MDVVLHHLDVRVERLEGDRGRLGLQHPNPILGVEDLALEVAALHPVEVDQADGPHPGCGQVVGDWRAQPARPNHQYLGVE